VAEVVIVIEVVNLIVTVVAGEADPAPRAVFP